MSSLSDGFSRPDFVLKAWINAALATGREEKEPLEQHAATLVVQLQHASHDLHHSLERISSQALLSIPRCLRELEQVKKEAVQLKEKIDSFHENLSKVEDGTVESMQLLWELDRVKQRLEGVNAALVEVDNLQKKQQRIEEVFTSKNYNQIADELEAMRNSLKILEGVQDFESQHQQLQQFQDRLDGITRPQLLQAFNTRDSATTLQLVEIYKKMDRMPKLLEYYYKCKLVPMEEAWGSMEKEKQKEGENPLATWLPGFYDEVLLLVSNEASWSSTVFEGNDVVLGSMLRETLSHFTSPFQNRIEKYIFRKENAPHALENLISVFNVTQGFSKSISSLISRSPDQAIREVLVTIFKPYFSYQDNYAQLEKEKLMLHLNEIKPAQTTFLDTITDIDNSVPKLFLITDDAIERCIQFTACSEAEGFVKVLNNVFAEYMQHLFKILEWLRGQAHLDISTTQTSATTYFDWNYFQGALQLLQIVQKISTRLSSFDKGLRLHLLQQKEALFSKNGKLSTVFVPCLHLLSNHEKARKLVSFFQSLDDVGLKLLMSPTQLILSYASSVNTFAFDAIFSFIRDRLTDLNTLEVWASIPEVSVLVPSFSLDPSKRITQIGEHLRALPYHVEPFLDNTDTLVLDIKALTSLNSMLESKDEWNITMEEGESDKEEQHPTEEGPEEEENQFAYQWMSAVGRATMSLYTQKIMEIPKISEHGAKQLETDINYLSNVLAVYGVPIDNGLAMVQKYVVMPHTSFDFRSTEGLEQHIASMIAKRRGISVH